MSESEACSLFDDRKNIDIQTIFYCESIKLGKRRFAAYIRLVVNVVCNCKIA